MGHVRVLCLRERRRANRRVLRLSSKRWIYALGNLVAKCVRLQFEGAPEKTLLATRHAQA